MQHLPLAVAALGQHEQAALGVALQHRGRAVKARPGLLERVVHIGQLRREQQVLPRRLVEARPDFVAQIVAQHRVLRGRQPPTRQQGQRHGRRPAQRARMHRIDVGVGGRRPALHEQRRGTLPGQRQRLGLQGQQAPLDARARQRRRRRDARGDQQPQARRNRGDALCKHGLQRLGHRFGFVEHQQALRRQRCEQRGKVAPRECRHVAQLLGLRDRQARAGGGAEVGKEARRVGVRRRQAQPRQRSRSRAWAAAALAIARGRRQNAASGGAVQPLQQPFARSSHWPKASRRAEGGGGIWRAIDIRPDHAKSRRCRGPPLLVPCRRAPAHADRCAPRPDLRPRRLRVPQGRAAPT